MRPDYAMANPMMFFDRALETQRGQLLTVMADAVSECRTAADQAAKLSVTAQFYALLTGCRFCDPVGMAIYGELHSMMASLMLGEWYE